MSPYRNYEAPQSEMSKYNEAAYQILRLHNIWNRIENYANTGQLKKWAWLLDSVWRELYADVKRQVDSEDLIKENQQHIENIFKAASPEELYKATNARHLFLKHLQDSCGKGGAYTDGSEDDFE